jgi:hypothetical protein
MIASKDVAPWLSALAGVSELLSPMLPGIGPAVARSIGAALGLAADLAARGGDPVAEISRISDEHPLLAGVRERWQDRIRARFPASGGPK